MAVAREHIDALVQRTGRTGATPGFRAQGAPASLDSFRQAVRSGLLELLDVAPWEARLDMAAAGQAAGARNRGDVVVADLEMRHTAEPGRVAADLLRACRPGGRIGIASPAPGSFLAALHARIEAYTSPSEAVGRRGFAGTREGLDALFGAHAMALGARDRSVTLTVSSAEHWLAEWRTSYAPLRDAYAHVDPEWRHQLTSDLLRTAALFAKAHEGKLSIRIDYLEFIVHKGELQ